MANSVFSKIRDRLQYEVDVRRLLFVKSREFDSDPNYNLALVDRGFENHLAIEADDSALLERIADAYNKAKDFQRNASTEFQVSNEWVPIYERHMREIMRALRLRDIDTLARIYSNFMRDQCSTGLHGLPFDMKRYYFSGKITRRSKRIFLYDSLHRYALWRALLGNSRPIDDLRATDVGNPYGYSIDGVFVRSGADYLHYYATAIANLIIGTQRKVVVELGGGFGGMAYYLCRDNDNLSYVDFDLPENMALTAYYLLKANPEKRALLFGEAELTSESVTAHDIVLMPSFEILKLANNSADIVFNSYSLAEMSRETIDFYISRISQITRQYFMHVNHNKYAKVIADDFGVSPEQFELVQKSVALWNGGRTLDVDEYEYLYRKR